MAVLVLLLPNSHFCLCCTLAVPFVTQFLPFFSGIGAYCEFDCVWQSYQPGTVCILTEPTVCLVSMSTLNFFQYIILLQYMLFLVNKVSAGEVQRSPS